MSDRTGHSHSPWQGNPFVRVYSTSAPASSNPLPHPSSLSASTPSWTRTHTCGGLNLTHAELNTKVILAGWLLPLRRLSRNLGFFCLQDAYGVTQVVVRGGSEDGDAGKGAAQLLDELESLPLQSVLAVRGTVKPRPRDAVLALGSATPTGEIELSLGAFQVLNLASPSLPFQPHDTANLANEELRARYRYLDLRRPALARNIQLRSSVAHVVRNYLHQQGFSEVETPILLRSTPEGAAEFIVPTRLSGSSTVEPFNASPYSTPSSLREPLFYALPQSPQQPKQLLVVSGCVDRYYQFARCFRDEDGRKDRQVEFTQIDMEVAFVSEAPTRGNGGLSNSTTAELLENSAWRMGGGEVRDAVEGMLARVWSEALGKDLFASGLRPAQAPSTGEQGSAHGQSLRPLLPVITYNHAMSVYGSDKPDRRFGLRIRCLSAGLRAHPLSGSESVLQQEKHDGAEESTPDTVVEMIICPASGEALSNKTVEQLLKELSGRGQAKGRTPIERFKARLSSPYELAALLLKKSRHVATFLTSSEFPASEVDVEYFAKQIEGALAAAKEEPWAQQVKGADGDACFVFVSSRTDPPVGGSTALGDLRLQLAQSLLSQGIRVCARGNEEADDMFWVTEFPLFTREQDELTAEMLGWSSTHHPFTSPMKEDLPLLLPLSSNSKHPASPTQRDALISRIRGQHYDLVLNGTEIGGGSVRVHQADIQELIMRQVLGLSEEETNKFAHLLHALKCGAPPHGGIALGFDRLMAIICKAPSIRDVIAFPKTSSGADPVFGSPAPAPGTGLGSGTHEKNSTTSSRSVLEQYGLRPL
ncbi:hypothetical protein K437DRAFT_266048 [Tilletiaria anomala UBC 951]|uniref:Aminoacyl-transfer RNA synthetases class-II family profile domain-containing protein n=1 Tax=Tilletiaria anomala (strain ATCC 24038 / CBS 436.72 / UBC 951) TaxID=1037660 RepID=A0A066WR43_TILAU|nr:uncharacterized protein K437DRAFT_266048 [Tilletiaria anomala UBC 951]KDN53115.1 hypothetical protein K437DRAFT_266048 [Tilletiaria anomala UBC 951]